jgi:hypothetical protein
VNLKFLLELYWLNKNNNKSKLKGDKWNITLYNICVILPNLYVFYTMYKYVYSLQNWN